MGISGWKKAQPDSLVVMVDQMWLWIVDEGMSELDSGAPTQRKAVIGGSHALFAFQGYSANARPSFQAPS
jgi:hypothetical protein